MDLGGIDDSDDEQTRPKSVPTAPNTTTPAPAMPTTPCPATPPVPAPPQAPAPPCKSTRVSQPRVDWREPLADRHTTPMPQSTSAPICADPSHAQMQDSDDKIEELIGLAEEQDETHIA